MEKEKNHHQEFVYNTTNTEEPIIITINDIIGTITSPFRFITILYHHLNNFCV